MTAFENIDNEAFKKGLEREDAVILDVRTPEELRGGIIPGAVHLDIHDPSAFVTGISDLDPDKAYYVYCRSGARSAAACAHMADMGFDELYNLMRGILEWDGPVER
ncbi:MAG: rhodanese-like domain-containing protein [Saprospiraceae bacterium]|nr:rhodanese-like domain-containing protein [Saprospiraceae bacterium]